MSRKRFVVKATEEQSRTWGGGVWVLGCRTVEDFLARCADVVCQRIERFAPRIEREEERKRKARVRERVEQEAPFWAAYDAAKKGEG
jgi:phosphopantetheinyl transferase (holo-ACP synthase)